MTRKTTRPVPDTEPSDRHTGTTETKRDQMPTECRSETKNAEAQEASEVDGQESQKRQSQLDFRRTPESAQNLSHDSFRKQLEAKHGHSMTKEAIEGVIRALNKPRTRNDKTALLFRYGDLYDDSYDGFGGEWPDRK